MTYLYWSVSISPVQAWIAEARRSRDLWIGSAIPSWLLARTVRVLLDADGELLMPDRSLIDATPSGPFGEDIARATYSLSNHASGRTRNDQAALDRLRNLQDSVATSWREVVEAVHRKPFPSAGAPAWRHLSWTGRE